MEDLLIEFAVCCSLFAAIFLVKEPFVAVDVRCSPYTNSSRGPASSAATSHHPLSLCAFSINTRNEDYKKNNNSNNNAKKHTHTPTHGSYAGSKNRKKTPNSLASYGFQSRVFAVSLLYLLLCARSGILYRYSAENGLPSSKSLLPLCFSRLTVYSSILGHAQEHDHEH
jgi:hypothetical protein